MDELFTTTVEVAADAPAARLTGEASDITGAHPARGDGSRPFYDRGRRHGHHRGATQERLGWQSCIRGPLRLRAADDESREWSFAGRLGSHDLLPPGGLSEPVKVQLQVTPGSDARLDFRIFGRLDGS